MRFTKMHGTGNDYVYVNLVPGHIDSVPAIYDEKRTLKSIAGREVAELAIEISDRHTGIGSDGLIAIAPSKVADVRMIMYNADGSEGAMCGNGIRCVAKYAYDNGLVGDSEKIRVETASGVKELNLTVEGGECTYVEVNMGAAILKPAEIPVNEKEFTGESLIEDMIVDRVLNVDGTDHKVTCVSMGNPHCVIFTEGIDELDLESIGPKFENHPAFPEKVNTEFVEVINDHTLKMRVWERGSGETMSCGTGTCAVTVAAVLNSHVKQGLEVEVQIRGGKLYDTYLENGEVLMKGPATSVYAGDYR